MKRLWQTMLKKIPLLRRLADKCAALPLFREPLPDEDVTLFNVKKGSVHKSLLAGVALLLTLIMLFAITAAWYSNVIQTTGLIFDVSPWGLDSSVDIREYLTEAAPGTSGVIDLSVQNSSDSLVSVTLNVNKGDLYNEIADMRKRLYFYVDDMVYHNGEYADRVYMNSAESYSYTVLSRQQLVLGTNGNGAPLSWEWVYDVLGYYFYGTVDGTSNAQIREYLRPVVYDFDAATFKNGLLQTVDGSTTVAQYLAHISEYDGYEGTIHAAAAVTDASGKVYYPVTVDAETGEGVWVYCCNLNEIEYENAMDTRLGNTEPVDSRRFKTYLHVLAQQKQVAITQVSSAQQLSAALSDPQCDMVQLSANLALSDTITVGGFSEKILDMNGYTITAGAASAAIKVEEGATFTVMNGEMVGPGTSGAYGIMVEGGDVTMSEVVVRDMDQAVRISDFTASRNDSRVTITHCELHGTSTGILIRGNGPVSAADSCLVIEDSTIVGGYYALTGNGTVDARGSYGTNIMIRNSTMRGDLSAIYHPQRDSKMTIEGSILEGQTAVAVKGGTIEIIDSTITAIALPGATIEPPTLTNSGFAATGSAVYLETNYNYPSTVTIRGNSVLTTDNVGAQTVLLHEATNPLYKVTITGGRYDADVSAFVAEGYVCVQDGDQWVVRAAQ